MLNHNAFFLPQHSKYIWYRAQSVHYSVTFSQWYVEHTTYWKAFRLYYSFLLWLLFIKVGDSNYWFYKVTSLELQKCIKDYTRNYMHENIFKSIKLRSYIIRTNYMREKAFHYQISSNAHKSIYLSFRFF